MGKLAAQSSERGGAVFLFEHNGAFCAEHKALIRTVMARANYSFEKRQKELAKKKKKEEKKQRKLEQQKGPDGEKENLSPQED